MKKIRYLFLPIFIIGLFLTACDKDVLTEEELLDLGSELSLSIQVVNQNTYYPIDGATVTIGASGKVLTATTDSIGIAHFSGLSQQNSVKVKVNKTGYFNYENFVELNTYSRSAGEHINVYLNSKENAAVIKGVVSIQTDLTTPESEHPEGITINLISGGNVLTSATTDVNGAYELEFPTGNGIYVTLNIPTLKYNQTLKVRRASDSTVVLTQANGTIFNPFAIAEPLPNTSNVIATMPLPGYSVSSLLWRASVKSLTINAGVITDLEFGDVGQGYYYWSAQYITITSLDGGSGANISFTGTYTSNNAIPFYPVDETSLSIISGGTGYPTYEPNENVYTMNPSGNKWTGDYYYYGFLNSYSEYFTPGKVLVLDINYGTGSTIGVIPIEYL